MVKLLTKRKERWVSQRPNLNVVRGTALNVNAATITRYQLRLEKLVAAMTADCEKQLRALFQTEHAQAQVQAIATGDASVTSQARKLTNALTQKYQDLFSSLAQPIAEQMLNGADTTSSAALHTSLKQLSGGLSLSTSSLKGPVLDVWKASITENVSLIKSIPAQYLAGVTQATQRAITTGNGLQDLIPYLQKHKGITHRRASSIAHDQTRKAFNNLNRSRMVKLGVKQFEWLHTSGSAHPRKLHIELSGQIFSFDDLPVIDDNTGERGIPGQAINCRCRMIPVLDLS